MRLAFGFMTGTSLDGLDAAAVRLAGEGLSIRLERVEGAASLAFPGDLMQVLRALASGEAVKAAETARAARALGELHADAARALIERAGRPDLACAHGQTVFHAPPDSWQLFNPWPLAVAAGCPVVHDLRGADLAAGGQGAPITPIADWALFRDEGESRAIVNLGGFCNITLLPAGGAPDDVRGMDVCACNHLLNAAARRTLGEPFDRDGAAALRGRPDPAAVDALAARLIAQRAEGRSLGTGDELGSALAPLIGRLDAHDALASVVAATARAIAQSVKSAGGVGRVLLAGGSARNAALVAALGRELAPTPAEPLDAAGVPATHREAACFALLGALCADRTPITLPAITGVAAPAPISGAWINTSR